MQIYWLIASVHRAFAAPDPEAEAFPAGDEKEKEIGDHSLQQIKRVLNLTSKPIFGSKSVENFVGRGEMEEANFDKMCGVVTAFGFEKLANKLLNVGTDRE
uniref:Myosin motor domain-containing protein n=1 Tax=Globodera pallida TaxID=36090 RepID=A0A183C8S2_GLOPA